MLDNYPMISIITVCFNSEKTIKQTIESVLNQTYTNIEYIIIDGKSNDETMEIVKNYEEQFKDNGIIYRYISEPDQGIYDAMNKGIKMTTGEWIGIINSDDWYSLDAVENIVNNLSSKAEVIAGICGVVDCSQELPQVIEYYQVSFNSLLREGKPLAHPAIFIAKKIYAHKLYDTSYKLAADFDFCFYLAKQGYNCKLIPQIISYFRVGGATYKQNITSALESLHIFRKYNFISPFKYYIKILWIKLKILRKPIIH